MGTRLLGRVARVPVEEGDRVQRGQVLARLEDQGLQARRQQLEAALQEAQAVLEQAGRDAQRQRDLHCQAAAPRQSLDEAETHYARDLGITFAGVLVLIYILVVAWFQSFLIPLVIMSAIPFSLVGIMPAHGLLGAFFTATSMIGFIAGAGIVVRNSIILVDFIQLRLAQGQPLEQAVVEAGAVRFRPMLLTAAAVIAGSSVILFDPIFQGLAISLMAGEVASLLLSRMAMPVLCYMTARWHR